MVHTVYVDEKTSCPNHSLLQASSNICIKGQRVTIWGFEIHSLCPSFSAFFLWPQSNPQYHLPGWAYGCSDSAVLSKQNLLFGP